MFDIFQWDFSCTFLVFCRVLHFISIFQQFCWILCWILLNISSVISCSIFIIIFSRKIVKYLLCLFAAFSSFHRVSIGRLHLFNYSGTTSSSSKLIFMIILCNRTILDFLRNFSPNIQFSEQSLIIYYNLVSKLKKASITMYSTFSRHQSAIQLTLLSCLCIGLSCLVTFEANHR